MRQARAECQLHVMCRLASVVICDYGNSRLAGVLSVPVGAEVCCWRWALGSLVTAFVSARTNMVSYGSEYQLSEAGSEATGEFRSEIRSEPRSEVRSDLEVKSEVIWR